jgi:hypothetical protein
MEATARHAIYGGQWRRLGWLAHLLSSPVGAGLMAGIAAHIVVGRLPSLLNLDMPILPIGQTLFSVVRDIEAADPRPLALGLGIALARRAGRDHCSRHCGCRGRSARGQTPTGRGTVRRACMVCGRAARCRYGRWTDPRCCDDRLSLHHPEEDTPFNAGLGFAVAMGKPGGFIGKDALVQQKAEGPMARRLVQVRPTNTAHPPLLLHNEPILRDGQIVGSIMSGAYGHRLGASLGLGYVTRPGGITPDWLESGRFEVEIAMKRFPAEVQFGPWYDPKGERIRS